MHPVLFWPSLFTYRLRLISRLLSSLYLMIYEQKATMREITHTPFEIKLVADFNIKK